MSQKLCTNRQYTYNNSSEDHFILHCTREVYVLDISLSGGRLWAYTAREIIGRGHSPRPIISRAVYGHNYLQTGRYLIYSYIGTATKM